MSLSSWFSQIRARVSAAFGAKRRCPKCGTQVSDTARTCFMCGASLPVPRRKKSGVALPAFVGAGYGSVRRGMLTLVSRLKRQRICPYCGAPVSQTAKVCSACEREIEPPGEHTQRVDQPILPDVPAPVEVEHRQLMRRCPACGARISQDTQTCPMCGADPNRVALEQAVAEAVASPPSTDEPEPPLPEEQEDASRSCPNCGAPIAHTAKRCTLCGTPVTEEQPVVRRARRWLPGIAAAVTLGIVVYILIVATNGIHTRLALAPTASPAWTSTATPRATQVTPATTAHTPTRAAASTAMATGTPTATSTPTATFTATPMPTETPTPTPIVHIVESRETLFSIAQYYGTTVDRLAEVNGLSKAGYLHPGDKLIIPSEGVIPTPTVPPSTIVHQVQEGEKLNEIANRYSVSEERIRAANNLGSDAGLASGIQLIIPLEPTITATPTQAPTATSTLAPPYPAPVMLYPVNNATFEGADATVMLQWASVGILGEDEWYALDLRYLGTRSDGQPSEMTVYTRITSWRVPSEWYPGKGAQQPIFEWSIYVVRQVDMSRLGPLKISPDGQVRTFTWL